MSELHDPGVRRAAGPQSNGGQPSGSGGADTPAVAPRARSGERRDDGTFVRRGNGRSPHEEGCDCTRCVGFTPGPDGTAVTRLTHGARSLVQIRPRAAEVAEGLQLRLEQEQLWRESFGPAVEACALVLVRLERAHAALDEHEAEHGALSGSTQHAALIQSAARWANAARSYLSDLGLTPRALAAIARDTGLARSTRTAAALSSLTEHVERTHS